MDKSQEIKEALGKLKDEAIEKIKASADETKKEVQDQINEVSKKFDERIAEIEKAVKEHSANLPGVEEEKEKFSFHNAFRAIRWNKWDDAGFEKEVIDNMASKANTATDGSTGGYLIPDEISAEVIDLAIANMPIMQMGITRLTGLAGDVIIPKITGRPVGYWVGENEAPTESTTTFGDITLNPKRVAGFTKVSNRLILQSRGIAESIIRDQLSKGLALKWNEGMIIGTGTAKQIKGLANYDGFTSTTAIGTDGGRLTVDKGAQMVANIDVADMLKDTGSFGYLMHPRVKWGLKRERVAQYSGDTSGAPLLISPILSDAQLEEMMGYMVKATTQIPSNLPKGSSSTCSYVFFGDFSQVVLAEWAGMQIKVSDTAGNASGSAFLQDQMWLVAQASIDMAIKDETGLTKLSDAETTEASW